MVSSEINRTFGSNAGYVEEQYERFLQDPQSVDGELRNWFESAPADSVSPSRPIASVSAPTVPAITVPKMPLISESDTPLSEEKIRKIVAAARLSRLVRELGHLDAKIDPLGSPPPHDPALDAAYHNLTDDDLRALPASVINGQISKTCSDALEAIKRLREAYSGSVGYEDDHIQIHEERLWLRHAVESGVFFSEITDRDKRDLLERLTSVETFERFLHSTPPFAGQKRFSIEGTDMLVPVLDTIIHCTALAKTREVVIGMAHRGRLNVLAHVLGKPYAAILKEFPKPDTPKEVMPSASANALGYSGDVKYHLGHSRAYTEDGVKAMPITLAPNPSHLEFVNPAVVGRARAAQESRDKGGQTGHDSKASLAILIHGDAAFPGQGVVAETLNLSQIPGWRIGGTIHIISNNQIGFTTAPGEGRSTLYASDLAKGFEIPIVHVNADDPLACVGVARMACAYREKFGKDFLIDLVGYRRHGHNEGDQPAFTQPRLYDQIRQHPTVREIWANRLVEEGLVLANYPNELVEKAKAILTEAKNTPSETLSALTEHEADAGIPVPVTTGVAASRLRALNEAVCALPNGFTLHRTLEERFRLPRLKALDEAGGINWGTGETLAYASILENATPIRLTGQDSERGTFGHRNAVLHDVETGEEYVPLQNIPQAQASFTVRNSALSETACLGFEYGYSVHANDTLVLWEAQFGDFANGAQVIIDQFIAAGVAKWGQSPSLMLLLPHGYEGSGPEHSSARLERFLQLCAGDNMYVVNCTTPAQLFHLLRRQAARLKSYPRPVIVMTPKSLLRHPRAVSSLDDLTGGSFQSVINDPRDSEAKAAVTRLILCSGKVYYDLRYEGLKFDSRAAFDSASQIAAVRIEELNPFPTDALRAVLRSYPALREVVWLQEEPRNMGAWSFIQPRLAALLPDGATLRYIGRYEAATPAEGSITSHVVEQNRIIGEALAPSPLENGHANGTGALKKATIKQKRTEVTENGR